MDQRVGLHKRLLYIGQEIMAVVADRNEEADVPRDVEIVPHPF